MLKSESSRSCLLGAAALTAATVMSPAAERSGLPASTGERPGISAPHGFTPANGWPARDSYSSWTRSLGGPTANRFSTLRQINRENVAQLERAWIYHSGDGQANVQCNPIIVGDTMYVSTSGHHVVALDAATGKERWRFFPERKGERLEHRPARRGFTYWPGDDDAPARILFGAGFWVYALDPRTGAPLKSFGQNGRTELPTGATVTGAVWNGVFVIPGFNRDVFGYDVRTGRMLWQFHTVPQPGEFGAETWDRNGWKVNTTTINRDIGGANCWGGMALDESRGIAYLSTGSPKPNVLGMDHLGQNLFGNCVLALDVMTGKRLWHFQEIRHDIWDLDIPAPPNLVKVWREGRLIDAVAQVTKIGNTLLLDRCTGEPLFPMGLKSAPASTLPGERTWPEQLVITLPEPFAKLEFTRNDITDRTPEARAYIEKIVANASMGWFVPHELGRSNVYFGVQGGAEWTGAAFNPDTGRLYVSSNHQAWVINAFRDDDPPPLKPASPGELVYQAKCATCHSEDRRGRGMVPNLLGLGHRMEESEARAIIKNGRNSMPPSPPLTSEESERLMAFLFARDRPPRTSFASAEAARYAFDGFRKLLDHENYPGTKPPWGTLNCLDLNTGRLVWRVPLGEHEELTRAGIPKTGTENYGGAIVTHGGLVFCSGTRDNKIRAFDSDTGAELWAGDLPLPGTAPPATYEIDGRQFIAIAATGGGKLGGPTGDAWVAFALPAKSGSKPAR